MIRVLFIGGVKHKQLMMMRVQSPWELDANLLVPVPPDEEEQADLNLLEASRTGRCETEHYRLRTVDNVLAESKLGRRGYAFAYVLEGISDDALRHYLNEPGMSNRLLKVVR